MSTKNNARKEFASLLEVTDITRGRVNRGRVFRDFVTLAAIIISNNDCDPGHMPERRKMAEEIMCGYKDREQNKLLEKISELFAVYADNLNCGIFEDILTPMFYECCNAQNGQDFTPPGLARLIASLSWDKEVEIPEKGYVTLYEPTCGAGSLLIAAAERYYANGIDYRDKVIFCATELDPFCARMAYVQAAAYSMTGVVIHGDTLSLKEYTRWYTPNYARNKWVFREPFILDGSGYNIDNDLLKLSTEPMLAAIREADWLMLPVDVRQEAVVEYKKKWGEAFGGHNL